MSNRGYWIRSGAYSMLQRVAAFLFGFGSYFLLVRYFSVDDFGVWTLYTVVSTTVEMSRSAFIQNAFVKFFNEGDTDKHVLFSSSLLLNFLSTIVLVIILLALIPVLQIFWHSSIIGILILWQCGISLMLILFTQFNYLEQANHSFAGVFWSSVVRQGSFFAIVGVCFLFVPGLSLPFFASMQLLAAFLGLCTTYLFTRKLLPARYQSDRLVVKKLFKFGKYILGTGITSAVGKNADQLILGSVSHGMVALYNSGVRVLNFIEIPSLSISNIVYPKIAERASREGAAGAGELYEKSVATILGFILPIIVGVLLFPELVLTIIAGKKYIEDAGALRIMAAASIVIPFNIQIGSMFEVMGKPHVSFYINLIANILNVILNIIFIKLFGIIGAASAFAITIIFIFVVGQYLLNARFQIHGWRAFAGVIPFYQGIMRGGLSYLTNRNG